MKSNILTLVLLCLFTVNEIKAQKIGFGSCATVPINSGFNASLYSGLWYEQYKFPVLYELGQTCITATYGFINSSALTVFNQGLFKLLRFNVSARGSALVYNTSAPNYLTVSFSTFGINRSTKTTPNYMVWATDYLTYSLVYSCTQYSYFGLTFKAESAWILSRQKQINSTVAAQLVTILASNGIDVTTFEPSLQNC